MPSLKSLDRNALLDCYYPSFRKELASLRSLGLPCSKSYEILAKSYGFKSWNGMYADLIRKAF